MLYAVRVLEVDISHGLHVTAGGLHIPCGRRLTPCVELEAAYLSPVTHAASDGTSAPPPLLKTADLAAAAPAGQPSAARHQYARAHTVRAWRPDYVPGDEGPPLEDLSDSDEEDSPAYLRFDSLYGHGAALSLQHHQPL